MSIYQKIISRFRRNAQEARIKKELESRPSPRIPIPSQTPWSREELMRKRPRPREIERRPDPEDDTVSNIAIGMAIGSMFDSSPSYSAPDYSSPDPAPDFSSFDSGGGDFGGGGGGSDW